MSDRRRFLKGLTSIPLATVLANPRLAAAVSAGLQEVEAKLADHAVVGPARAGGKVLCLGDPNGRAPGDVAPHGLETRLGGEEADLLPIG